MRHACSYIVTVRQHLHQGPSVLSVQGVQVHLERLRCRRSDYGGVLDNMGSMVQLALWAVWPLALLATRAYVPCAGPSRDDF